MALSALFLVAAKKEMIDAKYTEHENSRYIP